MTIDTDAGIRSQLFDRLAPEQNYPPTDELFLDEVKDTREYSPSEIAHMGLALEIAMSRTARLAPLEASSRAEVGSRVMIAPILRRTKGGRQELDDKGRMMLKVELQYGIAKLTRSANLDPLSINAWQSWMLFTTSPRANFESIEAAWQWGVILSQGSQAERARTMVLREAKLSFPIATVEGMLQEIDDMAARTGESYDLDALRAAAREASECDSVEKAEAMMWEWRDRESEWISTSAPYESRPDGMEMRTRGWIADIWLARRHELGNPEEFIVQTAPY